MVAARLRLTLALTIIAAFAAVRACGVASAYAFAFAILIVFALHVLMILATFAIAWPRGAGQKPGFPAASGMIAAECLAYFALFAIVQPFERLFRRGRGQELMPGQKHAVMLVHGYFCNRGLWWWLAARLRAHGLPAKAIDLAPPLGSIDTLAGVLHGQIEACLRESGKEKLMLVTHSMGGLVARAYLKRHGSTRVAKMITLACPHHGTRLAYLGFGRNARQMQPGSAWLCNLSQAGRPPVPAVSIWSAGDNFVAPQTSSRLEGAKDIVLGGLGHLSFAFSRRVLALLIEELSSDSA